MAAGEVDGLAAASSYYGRMVQANADLKPMCPTIVHLGRLDAGIPADAVKAAVEAANPDVPVYIYEDAGHGFNNEFPERHAAGQRRAGPPAHPGSLFERLTGAEPMGESVSLTSRKDGFAFGAYRAPPDDARRGGLVLIQEIFGVTEHIRELADGFAADGYETIAPSLFDRQRPASRPATTPRAWRRPRAYRRRRPGTRWPATSPPASRP